MPNEQALSLLRRLDLNLLLTFDTLMSTHSATRTARLLHKTQPGISRDLAKLRHSLGDELLVAVKGKFVPTERALELSAVVHDALQRLERAVAGPQPFDPARAEGLVTIGTGAHFELLLAAPLLKLMSQAAPQLIPRFQSVHGEFDPAEMDAGRQDMAIGVFEEVPPRFRSTPMFTVKRVAVMGPGHPLAHRKRLGLDDLEKVRWFAFAQMHGKRTNFDRALKGHRQKMHFSAYLSGFGISPQVLMDNEFATTMPEFAAKLHAEAYPLVLSQLPAPLRQLTFKMVWPRRQDASPTHRWVRGLVRDVVDDCIARSLLSKPLAGTA
ncbi:LysR substrate-binding domain-containing protein [soil metagenome]